MAKLTMDQRRALVEIEAQLRALLEGEFSSLTISLNDTNAPNYQTVGQALADGAVDVDWISEEQRQRAIETNTWWSIQWYPNSPVGFNDWSGASLADVVEAALADDGAAS